MSHLLLTECGNQDPVNVVFPMEDHREDVQARFAEERQALDKVVDVVGTCLSMVVVLGNLQKVICGQCLIPFDSFDDFYNHFSEPLCPVVDPAPFYSAGALVFSFDIGLQLIPE